MAEVSIGVVCGAQTRHGRCQEAAVAGHAKCRFHGGASTGPRTPQGRDRCRRANLRHGLRSRAYQELHAAFQEIRRYVIDPDPIETLDAVAEVFAANERVSEASMKWQQYHRWVQDQSQPRPPDPAEVDARRRDRTTATAEVAAATAEHVPAQDDLALIPHP